MTRMELFELIRREHLVNGKSIRQIAQEQNVHRRDVRRAIDGKPPATRRPAGREQPVLGSLMAVIDAWLRADSTAPRKQRHTSRRIWSRLVAEHDFTGAESTVRRYVGRRRRELNGSGREVFIEQEYQPGVDAQVDFGEAVVRLGGEEQKVYLLLVRCCYSGRVEVIAFKHQTQQCLLEGLATALARFGGVFQRLWFDNLTAAVKRVLKGRRRLETDRFVALRSHYLFESFFCRPGLQGAHEKGGVEGEVGRFRRNHLVPVLSCVALEDLNASLAVACQQDEARHRSGQTHSVGELWAVSRQALRPLPAEAFDTAEAAWPTVDNKSRVQVRQNFYSVPARLAGLQVQARVTARRVELWHRGALIAAHERLSGRRQESLVLDHYLEWFDRKPAAMANSKVMGHARRSGAFPECYTRFWAELTDRLGIAEGTRHFVRVLMLLRDAPGPDVTMAIELARSYGCRDAAAVEHVLRQLRTSAPQDCSPLVDLGALAVYERPEPDISHYDACLGRGEVH